MLYKQKSFSLATPGRSQADCLHGWISKGTGKCIFCGEPLVVIKSDVAPEPEQPALDDDATGRP
jgi:hypothetical protein